MVRVGFDISQLAYKGGVAVYTEKLTEQLAKIPDLEMVYFYSSLRVSYKGKLKNVKKHKLPPSLYEVLFNRIRNVGIEKFIGIVDIFHSSDWVQPTTKALKVTTYHDLVPIKYPKWSTPKIVEVHKRRLKIVEKEIDMVITVSESAKKDLLEVSNIPEEKITVIYEAASFEPKKYSDQDIKDFKRKYNLPEEFVLAIGGVGERRNMKRIKEATRDLNLVITGVTIPWLEAEELRMLYSSARVLLYPSFYEGFGLPILDAFTCNLPVITSNVSSMPEVGGDAALYVDPNDLDDIKSKLSLVLNDNKLRKEMIEKGIKQASKFSWEKTAHQTAEVYFNL